MTHTLPPVLMMAASVCGRPRTVSRWHSFLCLTRYGAMCLTTLPWISHRNALYLSGHQHSASLLFFFGLSTTFRIVAMFVTSLHLWPVAVLQLFGLCSLWTTSCNKGHRQQPGCSTSNSPLTGRAISDIVQCGGRIQWWHNQDVQPAASGDGPQDASTCSCCYSHHFLFWWWVSRCRTWWITVFHCFRSYAEELCTFSVHSHVTASSDATIASTYFCGFVFHRSYDSVRSEWRFGSHQQSYHRHDCARYQWPQGGTSYLCGCHICQGQHCMHTAPVECCLMLVAPATLWTVALIFASGYGIWCGGPTAVVGG